MDLNFIKEQDKKDLMIRIHKTIEGGTLGIPLDKKNFEWLRNRLGWGEDVEEFRYRGATIKKINRKI